MGKSSLANYLYICKDKNYIRTSGLSPETSVPFTLVFLWSLKFTNRVLSYQSSVFLFVFRQCEWLRGVPWGPCSCPIPHPLDADSGSHQVSASFKSLLLLKHTQVHEQHKCKIRKKSKTGIWIHVIKCQIANLQYLSCIIYPYPHRLERT